MQIGVSGGLSEPVTARIKTVSVAQGRRILSRQNADHAHACNRTREVSVQGTVLPEVKLRGWAAVGPQ